MRTARSSPRRKVRLSQPVAPSRTGRSVRSGCWAAMRRATRLASTSISAAGVPADEGAGWLTGLVVDRAFGPAAAGDGVAVDRHASRRGQEGDDVGDLRRIDDPA